jgi:tRNA pseudouridine55 synthase
MAMIGKINDVIAVYKPKGPTSFDIIAKLRKITGIKKIGHAGTLDPLAKGILVVGVGREGTRQLGTLMKMEKEYIAKIKFGYESSTDDDEGKKTKIDFDHKPTKKEIINILKEFAGEIWQKPPIYSAIKISGKRAYQLARQGKTFEMKPRQVLIKSIKMIKYKWPFLSIDVITGSGVYIRALAKDIGQKLGVGGYLVDLERVRVGDFDKKRALKI